MKATSRYMQSLESRHYFKLPDLRSCMPVHRPIHALAHMQESVPRSKEAMLCIVAEDVSSATPRCAEEAENMREIHAFGGRRGSLMTCARKFLDSSVSSADTP
jgi:hypothetical protein